VEPAPRAARPDAAARRPLRRHRDRGRRRAAGAVPVAPGRRGVRPGADRRRVAARGGGARRPHRVLPGRAPRRHRARPARRARPRSLGARQAGPGGRPRRRRARPRARTVGPRRPPGPPHARRTGAHGVPRPPRPGLRDPQVGRGPGPARGVPAARGAGAAREGAEAARALRQPERPHLVRPRDVLRPRPDPRRPVPRPVRRGLPRDQAGAGSGTADRAGSGRL
ncbi:MAG: LmbE family protein, partial [uncultured Pseudonocardia sp.]